MSPEMHPGRRWWAALGLLLTLSSAAWADGPGVAPAPAATPLLNKAVELAKTGDAAGAEKAFLEAIKASPDYVPCFMGLAKLYEDLDRIEEALELYAHVLRRIAPGNPDASRGMSRVFYRGRFPRQIKLANLDSAPVDLAGQQVRLSDEFHYSKAASRSIAQNTSLMFPEALTRGKVAPWVRLPSSIGDGANMMYNRVVYGLIADPGGEVLRTRWMAAYPSATVLASQGDYTDLAQAAVTLALRSHVYLQEYLDLDRTPENGDLLRLVLTEDGPTGAEQLGDDVFLFDVDTPRSPLELAREVFHEAGHLMIPRIGPFEGDDRWGNGDLGERLLFQWLVEEAGVTVQSPWPSDGASAALNSLAGIPAAEAGRYLVQQCRLPLDAWLATLPEVFTGQDAAERFAGFCMWVQAAHGRSMLAGMLHTAGGQTPADYMAAYKAIVDAALEKGAAVQVNSGGLLLMASKPAQPPLEGAIRRELIALDEGGELTCRVYLPEGKYRLTVGHVGGEQAVFTTSVDAGSRFVGQLTEPIRIGPVEAGWHDVRIACGSKGPVEITSLSFQKSP